jgi:hypothetical protein
VTSGEFTVTIDAKPEVVWPWVADLSKHVDWSPKPYRIEWLEGERRHDRSHTERSHP